MKLEHKLELYDNKKHAAIIKEGFKDEDIYSILEGADRFICYGETKLGHRPNCILDIISTKYTAEPHVMWFPWTTSANKIITFKWVMSYLSKTRQVLLNIAKKEKNFFEHFAKKGLLRKVGYLKNLPIVDEIHIYQYEGEKL